MSRDLVRRETAPWLFLVSTVIWTWFWFAVVIGSGQPWLQLPWAAFSLLAGLGPLVVGIGLIRRGHWWRDANWILFLRRVLDPRSLSKRGWALTLGCAGLLVVLPVVFQRLWMPDSPIWQLGPSAFLIIGFAFGALEEVGWRGYAQELLQRQMPIWWAGLLIGVFWSLWHLPLFFVEGSYQWQLGFGSLRFWTFMLGPVVASPFYAWLYNVTGRTAFAAVLFHGLGNVGRELVADPHPLLMLGCETALTLVVVVGSWSWMRQRR